MPIVMPDYGAKTERQPINWTPGRMAAKVIEIKESDRADRAGHNALVFKFEIIKAADPVLVGKKISKWFPLGGPGAKVLWRCLKTLNPSYDGRGFDTNHYINKKLEIDVEVQPDKEGKIWPKITKVYPYFEANEVATTLKANIQELDDFDV